MYKATRWWMVCTVVLLGFGSWSQAQEVKPSIAKLWELSGLLQIQYVYNPDLQDTSRFTNQGFFVRRGRLQVRSKLTDFFEATFQIEVRDNSPRLKDAEGKMRLFQKYHLRFGQFKVPVWREELRSDRDVMLVERSAIADYLLLLNLSARQIGVEFGRLAPSGLQFALNLSNGSGEGIREGAGAAKSGQFTNNGKMLAGRLNYVWSKHFELGCSAAFNQIGNKIGLQDNTGHISLLAPDFFWGAPLNASNSLEFEGGAIWGERKALGQSTAKYSGFDLTGRIVNMWKNPNANLGGIEGCEFAAGFSWLDNNTGISDDELAYIRVGPAVYLGKKIRLQCNGEWIIPSAAGQESIFILRSQANIPL